MTEFAILNADNEVTCLGWFDNEPTAHRILAEITGGCVGIDGLHVGEVCPDHDEAGRDGCKYCDRRAASASRDARGDADEKAFCQS